MPQVYKFKRCPCCKAKEVDELPDGDHIGYVIEKVALGAGGKFRIRCKCGVQTRLFNQLRELQECWNQRNGKADKEPYITAGREKLYKTIKTPEEVQAVGSELNIDTERLIKG